MDGKAMLRSLRDQLLESSDSGFMNDRTSYDMLYDAAVEFATRTKCLQTTQSITTVADQEEYTLDAEFIELWWEDSDSQKFIKLNDGSYNYFVRYKDYSDIILNDSADDSVTIPDSFSIVTHPDIPDQVTGTATSAGAATGGLCTLTDTAADFSDVEAGDEVHNTTDGSDGVVVSKTSTTALKVALFGGTDDDFTSADAYIIQPQGRLRLVFDPPPSTASYTGTIPYIARPAPVYSDYGIYQIQAQYHPALVTYALWKYKYRDSKPNFGDSLYLQWNDVIRRANTVTKGSFNRNQVSISWRGRR